MIDEEISRTIESKLDHALIKLYQQTKCLRVLMGEHQLDEILHKTSKYGKIVHLLPLHNLGLPEAGIIGSVREV